MCQKRCRQTRKAYMLWKRRVWRRITACTWLHVLDSRLNKWVRRRTVIMYSLTDAALCSLLLAFYTIYRRVAGVGYSFSTAESTEATIPFQRWYFFVSLLGFRALCSAAGAFAALNRKIRLTRFYFFTLLSSVFVTGVAMAPFFRCRCNAGDPSPLQVGALRDFDPSTRSSDDAQAMALVWPRRLLSFGMGAALLGTEGPQDTCTGFKSGNPFNASQWRENFVAADRNLAWQPKGDMRCVQVNVNWTSTKASDVAEYLRTVSSLASFPDEMLEPYKSLDDGARKCWQDRDCGIVRVTLSMQASQPQVEQCMLPLPLQPRASSAPALANGSTVHFVKDTWVFFTSKLNSVCRKTAVDPKYVDICRVVMYVFQVVTFVQLVFTMWMVPVLRKFLNNRCGDEANVESQFQIDWNVSDSEEDLPEEDSARPAPRSRQPPAGTDKAKAQPSGDDVELPTRQTMVPSHWGMGLVGGAP